MWQARRQSARARQRIGHAAVASICAALLMACTSSDKPKPTPLEPLTPKIAGQQVWTQKIGKVSFALTVAQQGGRFYVASDDGTVAALDARTGADVWRAQLDARIVAGVGSDGQHAAVVTRDNELIVLDGGSVLWRRKLDTAVSTPPLVAGERVFVLGVDRVVHGFDVKDGRWLWVLKRPGDPLTLAQSGVLTAYKDTLLVGQGPRLLGVDPLKGTVRWDVAVTMPRSTNEVERLADLVGPVSRAGSIYCMRSFQNAVGCVDAERRTLVWTLNGGGRAAVGGDDTLVYSADASDRIVARRRADGVTAWSSDRFLYRELSAPATVGPTVAFGDLEGQVHFLERESGQPVLRLPTDGSPIAAPPALADTTLLVVTRNGGLYAFRP